MFGFGKYKRQERKARKERKNLKNERRELESDLPRLEREREESQRPVIEQRAQQAKEQRNTARAEGRKYGEEVFNRDVQGLTPEHRRAIQHSANMNIKRNQQTANRKLLAQQGSRGIKGGAAYAQQADLNRQGQELRGQVERDTNQLDADMKIKKLAAQFGVEQGEAAQQGMDRQIAKDELDLNEEKRRQRQFEIKYSRIFNRV
jgi:hypothetical protein